jgi:hypothetical protein
LAPEPQALEILGPLTDEEHAEIAGAGPVPAPAGVFEKHHTPITNQESREEKGAAVRRVITTPAGGGGREQHTSLPPSRALEQATPEKSLPAAMDHKQPDGAEESRRPATVPVLVLLADVEIWAGRSSRCPESRWTVVVDVQDGSVTGAERLPGDRKNRAGEECLLLDFVGSFIAGVADGRHVAEVVLQ